MGGKHIEIFLVDGTPGGLTTAEIMNWTGQVLSARRSDMSALTSRRELSGTCVYLLLGESDDGASRCYVGETDDFATRLKDHAKNKDFWDEVVVVTSKDANLTKAHGRYLESKLIELAHKAGRVELDNGNAPPPPGLPEAHASDMDYFISQLQIILPVLGVDAIRVASARPGAEPSAAGDRISPPFFLVNRKLGVDARAQQIDGEFTVLAGSRVVPQWKSTGRAQSTMRAYASYKAQHDRLVADGAIDVTNGVGELTRDIVFGSPSTAGAIAQGRSCNGRLAWVTQSGQTFGDWEARGVDGNGQVAMPIAGQEQYASDSVGRPR